MCTSLFMFVYARQETPEMKSQFKLHVVPLSFIVAHGLKKCQILKLFQQSNQGNRENLMCEMALKENLRF